ncbi:MAG: tetratricopeptide repeat protein [Chitinophagaceae bacterium]
MRTFIRYGQLLKPLSALFLWGVSLILSISCNNKNSGERFIEDVRAENKARFDSLNVAIAKENFLYQDIEENINRSNFKTALSQIDTLFGRNKTDIAHVYMGMIYAKQGKFRQAIEEYNIALAELKFSKALNKRAEVYIKLNYLDSALIDYKTGYQWNFDYSLEIARVYELLQRKDSAIKYYQIYLHYYPNNKNIVEKINKLK